MEPLSSVETWKRAPSIGQTEAKATIIPILKHFSYLGFRHLNPLGPNSLGCWHNGALGAIIINISNHSVLYSDEQRCQATSMSMMQILLNI